MVLTAYFLQYKWLVLLVSVMTIAGAFSSKLNIPHQIYRLFVKDRPTERPKVDTGEMRFGCVATGVMLLIGFILLEYTSYTTLAWIYVLIIDAMIFLACFVGFCAATLIYVLIKNRRNSYHKQD